MRPQRPFVALALTLAVQTLTSITMTLPAVLAPAAAPLLGYRVEQVGYLIGLAYVLAMVSGLLSGSYVPRFGPLRMSQAGLFLCAAALAAMTHGSVPAFVVAGLLVGVAYGLTNPTAATLLGEHTPAHRRGLIFSIKQTGVPAGVALAGSLGPRLFESLGWQGTLLVAAAICTAVAIVLEFYVRQFDHSLVPGLRLRWRALVAPLGQVMRRTALRRLAFVSLLYAQVQVSLITFLVAHLTITHGLDLAHAAGVLALAQLSSVLARPFWGWLADRTGAPARLLGLLGIGTAVSCAALALLPVGSPMLALLLASLACAATGIGWNGVFYAELIHRAGKTELATVTGGVQFLTFTGAILGPILFARVVSWSDSYQAALLVLVGLALSGALWLLLARDEDEEQAPALSGIDSAGR